MSDTDAIERARYIKLGRRGCWESLCLSDGTLRLAYNTVPHNLALTGDLALIRRHFVGEGISRSASTTHANQVRAFYEAGPETVWITFAGGHLWWAVAGGPVDYLGGTEEAMAERGSRLRRTRDGWHNASVAGVPLRTAELNGALTQVAGYQGTICEVGAIDYLLRKLLDRPLPVVADARAARATLLASTVDLMRHLTWRDFELLVDLVFAESGWRRIGVTGGVQKTTDIDLILPSTGERAFVQVKSRTSQAQLDEYVKRLAGRDESRMFFVFHTAPGDVRSSNPRVTLVGPRFLSEMVLGAGLFDWLLNKVG